jgi:hypothetical protein
MSAASEALHPALAGFDEVILLSGFSGATVALVRDRGRSFVRKVANRPETNATLREQAMRQVALSSVVEGSARMPDVYAEDETAGLYHFDMAFVPSRDAVNFLAHGSFDAVAEFADKVERLMIQMAAAPPVGDRPVAPGKAVLRGKLDQIGSKLDPVLLDALAPLSRAVDQVDRLIASEVATAAHGDLTFENILVDRRGALWLIDTITSPFDHYWIDWSKLFQDAEGLWHAHRGRHLARGVTWWLRQRFHAAASRLDPAYPARHYVMLGLTFARILPYTKTEADRAFVAQRTRECGLAALAHL